jgi:translation initiation factor 2 subunit 1
MSGLRQNAGGPCRWESRDKDDDSWHGVGVSVVLHKSEWPSEEDLVICTISKVFPQGAFAKLDEYEGKEGMIHISEVASGWVKNIRDFVREGQKSVCKVLAVNPQKGHIDLSLRRVKDGQRRWKVQQWKREQRAEKLLQLAAGKIGKTLDNAYEEVGPALQNKFGDFYSAFESVAANGKEILSDLSIDKSWIDVIGEIAASMVVAPTVEVVGYMDLSSPAHDGVDVVKSAMIDARDSVKTDEVDAEFYYVGSPRYRLKVIAPTYKIAEGAMQKAAEIAIGVVKKSGGKGEFRPVPKGE